MDPNIISNQIQMIKNSLVFNLNNLLNTNSERIIFSKTYYFVNYDNPDEVYSVYGSENGSVLVDTIFTGKTNLFVQNLPIEVILFIKQELENYLSLKLIKPKF